MASKENAFSWYIRTRQNRVARPHGGRAAARGDGRRLQGGGRQGAAAGQRMRGGLHARCCGRVVGSNPGLVM
eukprot:95169-Prorocentrum_lima.AAC.1